MRPILAVDDNALDLELLQLCGEEVGLERPLLCYADAEAALAEVRRLVEAGEPLPACVLVDIRMPKMDGFELVEQLRRAAPQMEHVLLFTTSQHPDDTKRASELGVEVLTKPAMLSGYVDFLRRLRERLGTA